MFGLPSEYHLRMGIKKLISDFINMVLVLKLTHKTQILFKNNILIAFSKTNTSLRVFTVQPVCLLGELFHQITCIYR